MDCVFFLIGIKLRFWCILFNKAQSLHHILAGLVRMHPIHVPMILPHGWSFPTIFNGSLILPCIFTGSLPAGQGLLRTYELQRRQLMDITTRTKQYFPEDTGTLWLYKHNTVFPDSENGNVYCYTYGSKWNLVLITLHFNISLQLMLPCLD